MEPIYELSYFCICEINTCIERGIIINSFRKLSFSSSFRNFLVLVYFDTDVSVWHTLVKIHLISRERTSFLANLLKQRKNFVLERLVFQPTYIVSNTENIRRLISVIRRGRLSTCVSGLQKTDRTAEFSHFILISVGEGLWWKEPPAGRHYELTYHTGCTSITILKSTPPPPPHL